MRCNECGKGGVLTKVAKGRGWRQTLTACNPKVSGAFTALF